jgi:hypothetical protein
MQLLLRKAIRTTSEFCASDCLLFNWKQFEIFLHDIWIMVSSNGVGIYFCSPTSIVLPVVST